MFKSTWKTTELIGTLSAIFSVLVLWQHAIDHGWSAVLAVLLHYYDWAKGVLLSPVKPIVLGIAHALGKLWNINIVLPLYWSDIFVLCSIYLGSRAQTYWLSGLRSRAVFRLVLGGFCSLAICALVGAFPTFSSYKVSGVLLWVIVGLTMFEFIDSAWAASFYRLSGLTWVQDQKRYLAYSAPTIILGVPLMVASWVLEAHRSPDSTLNYGLIAFQGYVVALALYWTAMGILSSRDEQRGGTQLERFLASSNTRIGLLIGRVVLGATLFIIGDAGLNILQG